MLYIDTSRQYHNDKIHIVHGFSDQWIAGSVEKQMLHSIANSYSKKFPEKHIHVIVPNWLNPTIVTEYVSRYPLGIVVICAFTDPVSFEMYDGILSIEKIGYTDTGTQIDFWAAVCGKFFKTYTADMLAPSKFKYTYINYNRKPHVHRVHLVRALEQQDLIKHGIVTLGDTNYHLGESVDDYVAYGSRDVGGSIPGIPNDIYSLGRLDIWQQSFINIVSETVEPTGPVFLSEKIYKPIIGMRPFIINGSVKIYKWLQDAGFDCFEDLFPVNQLITDPSNAANIIANSINYYTRADLDQLYVSILPRLESNRARFFEYSKNELNKL